MTNHTTFAPKIQSPDMRQEHTCIVCGGTESTSKMVTGPFMDGDFAFICARHLRHTQLLISSLADYIAGQKLRLNIASPRKTVRNA